MKKITLHIIVDPLCGWTYASVPLIIAAESTVGLTVEIHNGGMLTGHNVKPVSAAWREFAIKNDSIIAQKTGQLFGTNYTDGLLKMSGITLDSAPAITAILAAQELGISAGEMLSSVQHAYYAQGQNIMQLNVLTEVAAELGLNKRTFETHFNALEGDATAQHIAQSRGLLREINGEGFPSAAFEFDNCQWQHADIASFYGKTAQWSNYLRQSLALG
ncbi:DsbA family protein [Pseudoalteromonas haloplanktis]|uniref:DsbA family protein n=1 Tax=Pseudoalteromonas haloplanktis TaxID=228 RepID=A0ABU1B9Y5_PSEHA|nr:DsbA family protein [Pseudoalteromonas haloplanktis]MDQ9090447.1 DsbA family protein [Pseudoalteromonas haloplanktis]